MGLAGIAHKHTHTHLKPDGNGATKRLAGMAPFDRAQCENHIKNVKCWLV